ncbi:MAG: hypothetical protein J0L93_06890 [Deltaproteobacteria bacterium]|nr:hypothetical protein [Deltaproteobacteria bacterium]
MLARISAEEISNALKETGYIILHDIIDQSVLKEIREFWLMTYEEMPTQLDNQVIWGPFMGEANKIGYSNDANQNLFRSFDFLWNQPAHLLTRDLCIELQKIKNTATEKDSYYGLQFSPDRFGMYVTTSYYPPNAGRLSVHRDANKGSNQLVHFIVPLTFKGTDYLEGGLFLIDSKNKRIDVDSLMKPGSVLFYDGGLPHGVDKIIPLPGKSIGRLQTFGITTHFEAPWKSSDILDRISLKSLVRSRVSTIRDRFKRVLGFENSFFARE